MYHSLRSARLAPIWVLLATLILVAMAAVRLADASTPPTGMVAAFVDVNGNDIDDTCEGADVVADADAVVDSEARADLDGDGTISVSEAAKSGRIGGKNCNHGGYVSEVARGVCDSTAPEVEPALVTGPDVDVDDPEACADVPEENDDATDEVIDEDVADEGTCDEVAPPERDPGLDDAKNGHGQWVSQVARSGAIGGKNCNHGGAVSEAAKKDHEASKEARDAAKEAREAAKAEHDAAKAERKAERDAAKAERKAQRDAAKAEKRENKDKAR